VRRGDIVPARPRRHEPHEAADRPALVVRSDLVDAEAYDRIAACLITASPTRGGVCRVEVAASSATGLERPCEIMAEKIVAVPREQVSAPIGHIDARTLEQVERALILLLGLG
jgi:mRNA interferase MazF